MSKRYTESESDYDPVSVVARWAEWEHKHGHVFPMSMQMRVEKMLREAWRAGRAEKQREVDELRARKDGGRDG